ncbi:MAG: methionyl aminopeptidase [Parcubacteria group bacterium Licking1014_17]|nr:MAG: methionyl aminopeptidase [Parcubacteria group bacterium Licking1014_17]
MSKIILKTSKDIEEMAEGGKIAAEILNEIVDHIIPGITTATLDSKVRELTEKNGVRAAFLGFEGFPASICTSVNDEVVHGIPSNSVILNSGDLISLDLGVIYKGWILDLATTVPVLNPGEYDNWAKSHPEELRLLSATKDALNSGIKQAVAGNNLGHISSAIQKVLEKNELGIVRELVGHGVGRGLHEEPKIPNYGSQNDGPKLEVGMVLAIEPMSSLGDWRIKTSKNGFTYRTADGSLSAHFEHTVAITANGPRILTESAK